MALDTLGPTRPRLLLVRHGRPVAVSLDRWLTPAGVQRWRDEYDNAGISPDEVPPPLLVAAGKAAACVVSSDLRRAITSAARIADGKRVEISPLLRETALDVPPWHSVRLPIGAWEILIHLQWMRRLLRKRDAPPAELTRAGEAAVWLSDMARVQSPVVAVTHGVFRQLLSGRLRDIGWRSESPVRRFGYWSVWSFSRTDAIP